MGTMIRRATVPAFLVLGGTLAVFYGARLHRVAVVEEVVRKVTEEREIEVPLPPESVPPPPFMEGQPPPFVLPPPPPIMVKKTVTETKDVTDEVPRDESEMELVFAATVGTLPQLASGVLRRPLDQGPGVVAPIGGGVSLCDT
jgi:hypothetical protein